MYNATYDIMHRDETMSSSTVFTPYIISPSSEGKGVTPRNNLSFGMKTHETMTNWYKTMIEEKQQQPMLPANFYQASGNNDNHRFVVHGTEVFESSVGALLHYRFLLPRPSHPSSNRIRTRRLHRRRNSTRRPKRVSSSMSLEAIFA